MNEVSNWKISKWPFLLGNAVLVAAAGAIIWKAAHPISQSEMLIATSVVTLGALLGCLPFILEYRAVKKLIEVNAVTTVAEQLHNLKTYSAQISTATDQWARVQEITKGDAEKTAAAAKEIKALIETAKSEVSDGVRLVNITGEALDRIVGQVVTINRAIEDIATSADEQANGLREINVAIADIH
jgi:methyl-accepting chemotaxis protein